MTLKNDFKNTGNGSFIPITKRKPSLFEIKELSGNYYQSGGFHDQRQKYAVSIYSLFYDKISENHMFRLIKEAIDFSFIASFWKMCCTNRSCPSLDMPHSLERFCGRETNLI